MSLVSYFNLGEHRRTNKTEEDKAKEVIKKAKVEDDEYHKNANEEQTYYRYIMDGVLFKGFNYINNFLALLTLFMKL